MAKRSITYIEAKELVPINTQNRFDLLEDLHQFPELLTENVRPMRNIIQRSPTQATQLRNITKTTTSINTQDNTKPEQQQTTNERKRNANHLERDGTALNNMQKVTEIEKWTQLLAKAKTEAQQSAEATAMGSLQTTLATILTEVLGESEITGTSKDKFKAIFSKYLKISSIIE